MEKRSAFSAQMQTPLERQLPEKEKTGNPGDRNDEIGNEKG